MNIVEWLRDNGYANADRHAYNIISLLKLQDLHRQDKYLAIVERVELYEAWRKSGMYKKDDRQACADKAIAGEPVPQPLLEMFPEDTPQNPFGDSDEEDAMDVSDCIHGIPRCFCTDCDTEPSRAAEPTHTETLEGD